MDTNGTTLWTQTDDAAQPHIMLCNISFQPGQTQRTAKQTKKLENKTSGAQPSKNITNANWVVRGEMEPDFVDPTKDYFKIWCDMFLNGRTPAPATTLTFEEKLKAKYVIATCDGKAAVPLVAWIESIQMETIDSDSDFQFSVGLNVQNNWCENVFSWDIAAGVPAGLEDFQTQIKAYYDGLAAGSPFTFNLNDPAAMLAKIQEGKETKKK